MQMSVLIATKRSEIKKEPSEVMTGESSNIKRFGLVVDAFLTCRLPNPTYCSPSVSPT